MQTVIGKSSIVVHSFYKSSLLVAALMLAACGGDGGSSGTEAASPPTLAGTLAGGVSSAAVAAYELSADGSSGALLGSASSDATGRFSIVLSRGAPAVRLVASGGSYTSAADTTRTVQGVQWSAVLPQVAAQGDDAIVLSPLSSFVDRRYLQLLRQAVAPATAREQADAFVRGIFGLQGSTAPLDRLVPDFNAPSGTGAAFAFTLGALEQLALLFSRSPLEVIRAMGEDLADGAIDGVTVGGSPIRFNDSTPAPSTLAGGSYLAALNAYLAPTNTGTLLARNGVTPDAAVVASLTSAAAGALRPPQGRLGNNAAVLDGPQIGSGVAGTAELRKPITVAYSGSLPLVFGAGWALRSGRSSDAAYIAVPVTNAGPTMLCFIQLSNLTYKDAGGNVLLGARITYVNGSIGLVGTTRTSTDTCLAPGATGYVQDISTALSWAAVSRMEFGVQVSSSTAVPALAALVPQTYAVQGTSPLTLAIAALNLGTAPGSLTSGSHFSTWIALDASSQPLFWGFCTDGASMPSIPVGGMANLLENVVFYEGTASRLLAQVDFDDAAPTAAGTAALQACAESAAHGSARDACMHTARMQGRRTAQQNQERADAR